MRAAEPQSFDTVLSSMCTPPHPRARDAAMQFLATNPGDPATYPTVARLEEQAVESLGEIVGLDAPAGYIAGGGTEANIQAVRIARNRAKTTQPNIVLPESAHFSFDKAAELLAVEVRRTSLDDEYRADVEAMRAAIDEDTILVVGVAGTTEYGRVDPIPAITELGDEVIHVHIDAAWGGFALPFTDNEWHFGHADIDTLTIDPHKLGRAAIPAGGFLARSPKLLESIQVETPYLESSQQVSLSGTRSGAGVASAAAALDALWPDGYRDQFENAWENANWLATEFVDRGYDVIEPSLPIVAVDLPDEIFNRLRDRGWRIAKTSAGELRIVCMPHVTHEQLSTFFEDLDDVRAAAANSDRSRST